MGNDAHGRRCHAPLFQPVAMRFEISTACNHKCVYCPVSKTTVRQRYMRFELFEHSLDLISAYIADRGSRFRRVQFNHYNEPVLDKRLPAFVVRALDSELFDHVLLNTNLSVLPEALIERLHAYRLAIQWNINMPTAQVDRYAALHGRNDFEVVARNIERLVSAGFDVYINCQVNKWVTEADVDSVRRRFGQIGVTVETVVSRNRAGAAPEIKQVNYKDRIVGCRFDRPRTVISIGVDGEVFLCCDDFRKESAFAKIQHHQEYRTLFAEIERACEPVYGVTTAASHHICRRCVDAVVEQL